MLSFTKKLDSETTPLNPLPIQTEKPGAKNKANDPEKNSQGNQQWSNSREFLLSCVAMSVGLGNVWRFPFTAYENGGGAFLIPYLIILLLIGRPMYFLELSMGQFSGQRATKVWEMVPLLRGIGFAQTIASFYLCSYYCFLIALAIFYFFASFNEVLPWSVCIPDVQLGMGVEHKICLETPETNITLSNITTTYDNITQDNRTNGDTHFITPTEQYLLYEVLKAKDSIEDGIGMPDARLAGCLALCYLLLFLTLWKGIASSGKVNIFSIF